MTLPVFIRIYQDGQLKGTKQFTEEQIVIGFNKDALLSLDDESVSPLHAVIEKRDNGYYISDLGSKTGTAKNGIKIFDDEIKSGDEIEVGVFRLEFFIGVPKPSQAPSKSDATPKESAMKVAPPPVPTSAPTSNVVTKATIVKPVAPNATKTIPFRPAVESVYKPVGVSSHLTETLRVSKGSIVEVVVAWGDRVISTHHFDEAADVTIGSDESCHIIVPLLGTKTTKHTFLKLGTGVKAILSGDMNCHLHKDGGAINLPELKRKNRALQSGNQIEIDLTQGEMLRVGLNGDLIQLFVRFIPEVPKPLVGPMLDLTASETTAIIMSFVVSCLFGLFMVLYDPAIEEEEQIVEEPPRKAVVVFKAPVVKKEIVPVEEEPKQKEIVKVNMDQKQTTTKQDPGKAAALKPNKENKKTNIVSSAVKQGGSVNTGKTGANLKQEKKDVQDTGLLGLMAKGGNQKNLQKATAGSGDLIGLADKATGQAGFKDDRAGDNIGGALKNVGAGGKGTSTVGVAGPDTGGKGTGTYGGGTGGIGKKGSVDLNIGDSEAEFSGSIDREAIRRVIRENLKQFEFCYNQALRRNADAYGKVEVQWNIEERGRATKSVVKTNSTGDKQMGQCIARVITGLTFPEPPPDQIAQVIYPFVFSSQ